ncbi:MAG: right-handed parallel beta-helix repeat-containing protein [Planctomycetaceae bacterium]|nr:right-handed parallel beta-helix repeat-containing protein [Planctomycetaceae bacterium]
MKTFSFVVIFLSTFFLGVFTLAQSQDWEKHRQTVIGHPDLIRYYVIDNSVAETKIVRNLAPNQDSKTSDFSYKTNKPFEITEGQFAGSPAVQIDAGYFESAKLNIDNAFSVEMRVRKLGQGTERDNNNSANGTLFGYGNGWDSGFRLTTDYPSQKLVFSIGRPDQSKSHNLVGNQPVSDGVWQHITATWDGKTMRIYLDGLLYAITDYTGGLTEPSWGFRIGFNNAGVGSVKMDIAETAVYKSALTPEEILQHALLQPKLPENLSAFYRNTIDSVLQKEFIVASQKIEELLQSEMLPAYRFSFRNFQTKLAALAGNLPLAQRLANTLLNDPEFPKEWTDSLLRQFIPTEWNAPLAVASSNVYRRILDDKTITLDAKQRFTVEKCFAEALFAETLFTGERTAETKHLWDILRFRETEIVRETLNEFNVSSELSLLYRNYRKEQDAEVSKNRFVPQPLSPFPAAFSPAKKFFVAPDDKPDDEQEYSGTESEPFSTLVQARNAVRKLKTEIGLPKGGVEIIIRGGVYPVTETFVLEAQDSGTADAPIVYRAFPNEKPVFSGGVTVKGFRKADDPSILKRLPEESRGFVLTADVTEIQKFPPVAPRGYGKNGLNAAPAVELYIDNNPQQIARWPNAAQPDAVDPLKASENAFVRTGKIHRGFFNTPESGTPGIFEYSDSRHERWTEADDAMVFGYWGHLWGITSCRIDKIDTETKQVVLATNNPYGHRENMPYYAFNLLEEIDLPGEWYLDRANAKLYLYPPKGVDPNTVNVRLSAFSKEFLNIKDVSFTTFYGLTFEEGSGTAGRVIGGEEVLFTGCGFYRFGNWGLGMEGRRHGVLSCDFRTLGGGGIHLKGGDIKTLIPGGCFIENSIVHNFSRIDRAYAPAVLIDGVANRISHNLFCDSPAHAIRCEGMEQIIEFNEIHSVVYESDDQSGIDLWGNPFMRGIVIRYNYWHHIGSGRDVAGQSGIRLDDMISSVLMYGNVFFRSSGGQFGGIQIHGGKDNIVDSNLMIDCKYAVSFSPWGEKRWLANLDKNFGTRVKANGFDPDNEVYRSKYPDYAELKQNADRNFIVRNIAVGCDNFARNNRRNVLLENIMLPWLPDLFVETKGLQQADQNRVPADARKIRNRLTIPADSPLYEFLGIKPLPIESMGLYTDKIRTEIPKIPVTPFFVLE